MFRPPGLLYIALVGEKELAAFLIGATVCVYGVLAGHNDSGGEVSWL